jgi:hypothetical protein
MRDVIEVISLSSVETGLIRRTDARRASVSLKHMCLAGPIDESEEKPHAARRVANFNGASPRGKIGVRARSPFGPRRSARFGAG